MPKSWMLMEHCNWKVIPMAKQQEAREEKVPLSLAIRLVVPDASCMYVVGGWSLITTTTNHVSMVTHNVNNCQVLRFSLNQRSLGAVVRPTVLQMDDYHSQLVPARRHHATASLSGRVYVVGGQNHNGHPMDSVTRYDPVTRQWCDVASLQTARHGHGVAVLNGKLYAVGGITEDLLGPNAERILSSHLCDVECYNELLDQWVSVAPMNTKRWGHAVAVLNNKLYAVGGFDGGQLLSSVEYYDDQKNQWVAVNPMSTERLRHGVGVLHNKLYVMGGEDNYTSLKSMEYYEPDANQWLPAAPMAFNRYGHGVGVLQNKLFVVGGCNHENADLRSTVCYDPTHDKWEEDAPLSTAPYGHSVTCL